MNYQFEAANVNFGIKNATGKLVKLLYVDDFFMDPNALLKIKTAFGQNFRVASKRVSVPFAFTVKSLKGSLAAQS